jgi:NADH-quinone oxidoreductase subunit D
MLEPGIEEKTFILNLGPQHPSTHGVLRVILEMDGEFIAKADPVIGYGHRGHEHMAENRNYLQFLPNMGRVDYLHALAYNQCYCMAVEKLMGIVVPERAEFIRVITNELNRITSHLL